MSVRPGVPPANAGGRNNLRAYIRYQLFQLSARNGEHEFEQLALQIARRRVASNFLPATGPVQSGGDHGRDFESFSSSLAKSPIATSTFAAMATNEIIVGAVTLNKEIIKKIKYDLTSIFSFGSKPHRVVYFCEPDIPIYKRHKLQELCKHKYDASLDIFDGQAISEMLTDLDLNWIADEYLSIPSELWPQPATDEWYGTARERWLLGNRVPENYGDFLEIRRGARVARAEELRLDLRKWIELLRLFVTDRGPSRLRQRARYEIAVAELRGHGSLNPALHLVRDYFKEVDERTPAADLLDAAVLVVYASAAKRLGEFSMPDDELNILLRRNDEILNLALKLPLSSSEKCLVLEAQANTALLPRDEDDGPNDGKARFYDKWGDVLNLLRSTPLHPVEQIADIFEKAAESIGPDERLRLLIQEVDKLIEERMGKAAAAERAYRRAWANVDAKRYVAAIDEFQDTKSKWFNGDNIEKSILTLLCLSECYQKMSLYIASRYYAAAALYAAINFDNDRATRLLSLCAFRVAGTYRDSGESVSYFFSIIDALGVHYAVAGDADEWSRHDHVSQSIAGALILRAIASKIAPHVVDTIDDAMRMWPLSESEITEFRNMTTNREWQDLDEVEVMSRIEKDFSHAPFGDIGEDRFIVWAAHGINWVVSCRSVDTAWPAALEFAAAVQIIQVELADLDLLIVPSNVRIQIEISETTLPKSTAIPDNERSTWRVDMPVRVAKSCDTEYFSYLIATIITIIVSTTAMPEDDFRKLVERKFKRGSFVRMLVVRPIRELMMFAKPSRMNIQSFNLAPFPIAVRPQEAKELCWRGALAPGYSRSSANEFLRNRYEISTRALRLTLPRIVSDQRCREIVLKLRREGVLDWQLLGAVLTLVCQVQLEATLARPMGVEDRKALYDRTTRAENEGDPQFDLENFTEETLRQRLEMNLAGVMNTWGLAIHSSTPNFCAIKTFLDQRYRNSTDDVPHADPFAV